MRPKRKKTKSDLPTISGYFRQLFAEKPEWLKETSNDAILERYRTDHGLPPGAALDQSIKSNLANIKSVLRKQSRGPRQTAPANRVGRVNGAMETQTASPMQSTRTGNKLEPLEEMIDNCRDLAKSIDRDGLTDPSIDRQGLAEVLKGLRRCQNKIVWMIGEKTPL